MDNKQMQFLADSVMAQEIALSALINALLKHHPDITAEYIATLEHVLKTSNIPTRGARTNIQRWRDAIAANHPSTQAAH
ncbi:MAG: hypothetical protein IE917_10780 [Betaproteobacteria bacterium]|nr:hypothetical protein [Betaproteobacteria bacterium]